MINSGLFRLIVLILHALINVIFISFLFHFDLTGSWLRFAGFSMLILFLFLLFIAHLVSFINFLKPKP